MRQRPGLLLPLVLVVAGCDERPSTDDAKWAFNGPRSGVFEAVTSVVGCTLKSLSASGPTEPHAELTFALDGHPQLDFLMFTLVPLPDATWGQRSLMVGQLGVYSAPDTTEFYRPFFGRLEASLGKVVPHSLSGSVRELFVHHLVLPEQPAPTPSGQTFPLAGRVSDLRLYCEDWR